ncbi:MAG TPA: tetratricopeptide repeat protein [Phycisphaerae bacterium]|nr:tetratricopeptide repeat protein [Phycisphaerae bacterium]
MAAAESNPAKSPTDQDHLVAAAWKQVEGLWSTAAREPASQSIGPAGGGWDAGAIPGYRIEAELQRGGQGVVYRGIQESTQREVAIKVMRDGPFAGPRERARFEREVQILAQLRHPNIVTIHDSGVAGHAAYFVMDYIAGEPLNRYVTLRSPDLPARLRLFAKICAAVNVAHLRGVIHRDLKPGNLRVDPSGEPHVLDFGLAKRSALEDKDDTHADMTVTGQFVGSLPWASPEQAEGRSDRIDLRTDVYSLGVILYQLLTGDFPYEVSGSLSQTTQNIVHREARHPRVLNRRLDDEICTIVLKALRKDREDRYQTAGSLGREIERYLAGEPLEAKRDSITYMLRKQLARHKIAAGVIAGFFALIVVGFGVSLTFWRQAVVARNAEVDLKIVAEGNARIAEERAERAATEAAKAAAVTRFLTDMLESASPARGGRADVSVHEALDAAAERLSADAFADQPEVAAAVRRVLGSTYSSLGLYDAAISQFQAARGLYAQIGAAQSTDAIDCAYRLAEAEGKRGDLDASEALYTETIAAARAAFGDQHLLVAMGLNGLSGIMRDRGKYDDAERFSRESLAIVRAVPDAKPDDVADTLNDLALVLDKQARDAEAQAMLTEALALYRAALGPRSRSVAVASSNLASTYVQSGDFAKATALYEDALSILREIGGEKHPDVASALASLGLLRIKAGEFSAAVPYLQQSLDIRRELFGDEHPLVAQSLNNLAIAQFQLGELTAAADCYAEAIRIYTKVWGPEHPALATLKGNLAAILRTQGRAAEAVPLLRESLAVRIATLRPGHPEIANAQSNLGRTLADIGALDEAESLLRASLAARQAAHPGDDNDVASSLDALAEVLEKQKRLEEAEAISRDSVAMRRRLLGDDHIDVANSGYTLALILRDRGAFADAVDEFNAALRIMSAKLPADHWRLALLRSDLAVALAQLGRTDEAETALLAAYEPLRGTLGDGDRRTQNVIRRLVDLYDAAGDAERAQPWRQRLSADTAGTTAVENPAEQPQ